MLFDSRMSNSSRLISVRVIFASITRFFQVLSTFSRRVNVQGRFIKLIVIRCTTFAGLVEELRDNNICYRVPPKLLIMFDGNRWL